MSKKEVQRGGGRVFTPLKGMFLFLALILMLAGSLNASGCGTIPLHESSLTEYCIPITVAASSATSNAQVMLTFNALNYQSYLSSTLQNIYVYNGIGGYTANTWVEGNIANGQQTTNLNTVANVIIWINDPTANIISTSADSNYYIGIGSTSTNFFVSGNNIGEAPQLSSTYAEYDDGASVFSNYWNFNGTTLPSGWSPSSSLTASVNNGVTLTGSSTGQYLSYSSAITSPFIFEIYGKVTTTEATGAPSSNLLAMIGKSLGTATDWAGEAYSSGYVLGYGIAVSWTITSTTWSTGTFYLNGVGLTSSGVSDYVNYKLLGSSTSSGGLASAYLMIWQDNSTTFVQWLRTRAYPPNGVMPSVSFGAVQASVSATLSISPNPPTYGSSILITATCSISTDSCAVDYPTLGTHLCTGTGSCTYTYPAWQLAAGTYSSYYANDITSGTNSIGQTLTVNKNSTVITWTAQCQNPTMLIFSNPNPCITTGYAPSNANQLVANLYLNNLLESSTSSTSNTATYSLTTNNIGNYGFVFNTLGNGNYIANSISYNTLIYAQVNVKNVSANGNVISFAANVQANPYTWNTYFPYGFFTSSPSNTLNFTLSQLFDSALSNPTRTALQTNVLNLSYIPQSSQPTGNYLYNITERQIGNAQTVRFSINAVSANMIDFNGQLNFIGQCDKYIQYFPNCAVFPYESNVFTVKPLSWSIKSDMLVLQHSNFTGAVANTEQWSNANITFTPTYSMSYPSPFGSYTVNLIDNPSLQQTLTQTAFKFYTQNTVPASPYTRKITNVSTYDQQLFTPLYTNDTNLISLLMNNYTIPQNSSKVVNSIAYNTYIALSDYQNPAIYFYNSTILSSTKNHYSTVNNYCPITLTNGNFATYKPYLANLNASLYTFDIYQGSGYGATNYTMVVETGASPSSAIEVQSYKINQVPFALPLQNGQEYRFLFYNKNCTLVYTSPFSIWPQTITLYLPSNQSLGQFSYSLANAYCNTYHNSKIEYVICNGQDPTGLTSSWDVNITQPSVLSIIPVANYSFASSSFMLNWTVPNSMKLYTVNIYYNNAKTPLDPLVVSYPVNPKSSLTTVESYGLMSLFFFLVMVIAAFSDIRAAIVMGLLSIFIGGIAQLNLLTLTSFAVLTIIGGTVVFLLRNKFGE